MFDVTASLFFPVGLRLGDTSINLNTGDSEANTALCYLVGLPSRIFPPIGEMLVDRQAVVGCRRLAFHLLLSAAQGRDC